MNHSLLTSSSRPRAKVIPRKTLDQSDNHVARPNQLTGSVPKGILGDILKRPTPPAKHKLYQPSQSARVSNASGK